MCLHAVAAQDFQLIRDDFAHRNGRRTLSGGHQADLNVPAALAQIGKLGLNLAVQDAFWLSLVAFALAFIAVCFIRVQKAIPQQKVEQSEQAVQQHA